MMIAIVPMKEISERVPHKNVRLVNGQPLFFWIFKTLHETPGIDQIILTTDSKVLAQAVNTYFPEVLLHFRPDELIGNHITANALIEDVLDNCFGYDTDFLFTHVTNPLLKASTIDDAITKYNLNKKKHDSLMGVTKHQIRLYNDKRIPMNHDPKQISQTQALSPVYEDNSCIYIFSRTSFKHHGRVGAKPYFYEISKMESIDIDHEEDLLLAERIMQSYGY